MVEEKNILGRDDVHRKIDEDYVQRVMQQNRKAYDEAYELSKQLALNGLWKGMYSALADILRYKGIEVVVE